LTLVEGGRHYARTVGRMERRRSRRGVDPVAEAQARAQLSSYSPGTPKPGLGFHRYRASLRRSGAWPFLRTLLLVILALIVVAVVLSLIQASE
jgi:hypothetical protein